MTTFKTWGMAALAAGALVASLVGSGVSGARAANPPKGTCAAVCFGNDRGKCIYDAGHLSFHCCDSCHTWYTNQ